MAFLKSFVVLPAQAGESRNSDPARSRQNFQERLIRKIMTLRARTPKTRPRIDADEHG
jgi:hypothetical protein